MASISHCFGPYHIVTSNYSNEFRPMSEYPTASNLSTTREIFDAEYEDVDYQAFFDDLFPPNTSSSEDAHIDPKPNDNIFAHEATKDGQRIPKRVYTTEALCDLIAAYAECPLEPGSGWSFRNIQLERIFAYILDLLRDWNLYHVKTSDVIVGNIPEIAIGNDPSSWNNFKRLLAHHLLSAWKSPSVDVEDADLWISYWSNRNEERPEVDPFLRLMEKLLDIVRTRAPLEDILMAVDGRRICGPSA